MNLALMFTSLFDRIGIKLLSLSVLICSAAALLNAQTLEAYNPNLNGQVNAVAIQADGKTLIGGSFTTVSGQSRPFLARINLDGTLDAGFPSITSGIINDIAVQADGKILFCGDFFSVNGTPRHRVARLNADGTLDTGFDANLSSGTTGVGRVTPLADGRALISITNSSFPAIRRLNSDGSQDTTFTSPSFAAGTINAIIAQPDGKIIASGSFTANGAVPRKYIARLESNGGVDLSFQDTNPNNIPFGVTLAPDGKIYAFGSFTTISGQTRSRLARLNSDGSIDPTFQDPAFAGATNPSVNSIILLPSGKIVVVGRFETIGGAARLNMARINNDGTPDTAFRNMLVGTNLAFPAEIVRQPDGKFVFGGTFLSVDNQTRNRLARVTAPDSAAPRPPFDFDGDGRADLSVFRPGEGNWYLNNSQSGFAAVRWGLSNDKLAPADYDGDGRTDTAVWRSDPSNPDRAYFYILNSATATVRIEQFGSTGDMPHAVGDWDGDGRADPAVYRSATNSFYYRPSSLPAATFVGINWGAAGDAPLRGDFDGDGRQDAAVFRASNNTWYIRNSSDGAIRYDYWGTASDKFVSADYDGDGRTDLAVFRDGTWYIKQSSNDQPRYEQFGLAADAPVPADYDGDGRADIAVFRSGAWYIKNNASGLTAVQFGASSDAAVPNVFVGQ